jgi:hypothetical protein
MSRRFVPILFGVLVTLTPGQTGIAGPKDEKGDPGSTTVPIISRSDRKGWRLLCQ